MVGGGVGRLLLEFVRLKKSGVFGTMDAFGSAGQPQLICDNKIHFCRLKWWWDVLHLFKLPCS